MTDFEIDWQADCEIVRAAGAGESLMMAAAISVIGSPEPPQPVKPLTNVFERRATLKHLVAAQPLLPVLFGPQSGFFSAAPSGRPPRTSRLLCPRGVHGDQDAAHRDPRQAVALLLHHQAH
jgi:hypothetical protein